MEDTLWDSKSSSARNRISLVLILILLEDTLWATALSILQLSASSLNPYSIGRYSMRRFDINLNGDYNIVS